MVKKMGFSNDESIGKAFQIMTSHRYHCIYDFDDGSVNNHEMPVKLEVCLLILALILKLNKIEDNSFHDSIF